MAEPVPGRRRSLSRHLPVGRADLELVAAAGCDPDTGACRLHATSKRPTPSKRVRTDVEHTAGLDEEEQCSGPVRSLPLRGDCDRVRFVDRVIAPGA
jgi:hypothetical protein